MQACPGPEGGALHTTCARQLCDRRSERQKAVAGQASVCHRASYSAPDTLSLSSRHACQRVALGLRRWCVLLVLLGVGQSTDTIACWSRGLTALRDDSSRSGDSRQSRGDQLTPRYPLAHQAGLNTAAVVHRAASLTARILLSTVVLSQPHVPTCRWPLFIK